MSETSLKTFEQTRIEQLEEAILEHEMKIDALNKIIDTLIDTLIEINKSKIDLGGFC